MQLSLQNWLFFILIFARVVSIISLAPVYGGRNLPAMSRIGFSALLSYLFYAVLPQPAVELTNNFWLLLPGEVLVGLGIGYVTMLFFNAVQMAGNLIDIPMGFTMVNVFDPNTDTQLPIMGNFYYVLAMLLFLVTNAHQMLLAAMLESYQWFGLGHQITGSLLVSFGETFAAIFLIGVKISIPVVGVMLMSDVALALLARTVPSLNAFILGVPVKIALGVVAMLFCLSAFIAFSSDLFLNRETGMVREIMDFLRLLGGGS